MSLNIISVLDDDRELIGREMERMGVHPAGIRIMSPKSRFRVVKIKDVPVVSANIIKQDILSFGGEAATSMGTINHSVKKTDVLIFATDQQIKGLLTKLRLQYFGLKQLAKEIEEALESFDSDPKPIKIKGRVFDFSKRTYIMGILNVTPDSFSDGGQFFDVDTAVEYAKQMIKDGADIIDIGGESTRPGAKAVSVRKELERVLPVIKRLKKETKALISIDTTKSKVAAAAVKAGASMINDISGLNFDKGMARVAAKFGVPVVVMHIQGKPRTMQKNPRYNDLISDIISCLQKSIGLAIKCGIPKAKIIIDPGFGFGKTPGQNLEILKRLKEFKSLGCPVLIGTSRKSTIGKVLGLPPDERIEGTAATVAVSIMNGASIVRVHDVKEMSRVARMCDPMYKRWSKWR